MAGHHVDRHTGDAESEQETRELRSAGRLTLADFAPLVGERFRLELPADAGEALELIEAEPFTTRRGPPRSKAFSLIFRAPMAFEIPQVTVRLHHEAIGTTDLFVVTVGADDEGRLLEAVFN